MTALLAAESAVASPAAFPLLTAGLLVGAILLQHGHQLGDNWLSLKVLSTAGLWLVFLVLLYNVFAWNAVGRDPAKGTIIPLFHPPADLSPAQVQAAVDAAMSEH